MYRGAGHGSADIMAVYPGSGTEHQSRDRTERGCERIVPVRAERPRGTVERASADDSTYPVHRHPGHRHQLQGQHLRLLIQRVGAVNELIDRRSPRSQRRPEIRTVPHEREDECQLFIEERLQGNAGIEVQRGIHDGRGREGRSGKHARRSRQGARTPRQLARRVRPRGHTGGQRPRPDPEGRQGTAHSHLQEQQGHL